VSIFLDLIGFLFTSMCEKDRYPKDDAMAPWALGRKLEYVEVAYVSLAAAMNQK